MKMKYKTFAIIDPENQIIAGTIRYHLRFNSIRAFLIRKNRSLDVQTWEEYEAAGYTVEEVIIKRASDSEQCE